MYLKTHLLLQFLYDNKKENFEVKSDPVEFEMKIKPYLKKFKQSGMLIIMEHSGSKSIFNKKNLWKLK
jgi:hypothetical protein